MHLGKKFLAAIFSVIVYCEVLFNVALYIVVRNIGTGGSGSNVLPRFCNLRKVPFDIFQSARIS